MEALYSLLQSHPVYKVGWLDLLVLFTAPALLTFFIPAWIIWGGGRMRKPLVAAMSIPWVYTIIVGMVYLLLKLAEPHTHFDWPLVQNR